MVTAGSVCEAFVARAPVDGAAFTMMASDADRDTVCASDPVIAGVEQSQYGLGEGPTLEAFTTRRPVILADMSALDVAGRWPLFGAVVVGEPIGALFVIPMQLGAVAIGVCAAYRRQPGSLTREDLALLLRAVDHSALALLALRAGGTPQDADDFFHGDGWRRRAVHQATGMLIAQLGVGAEEAFARLRANAFAEGRSIEDVASDVVARRLRLERDLR